MNRRFYIALAAALLLVISVGAAGAAATMTPERDTPAGVTVSGELKLWHAVTLTFDGPNTSEDASTNPFLDYRLEVTFTNGGTSYTVPGYYAADGDAANTSADSGDKWRVHFTPDQVGEWTYTVSFVQGADAAINPGSGSPTAFDGTTGSFTIAQTDKAGQDFRGKGTLRYVGEHHLQFAGTGEYFLKNGADSPENFLGYFEFDGTYDTGGIEDNFLHEYEPHAGDWRSGDPTWGADERGKNIIGAVNYLASQNINSIYFLTYNIDGGDGADTWPWTSDTERERFDVSKLDQWNIVFSHMTANGVQMHVVTQEIENDQELGGNGELNDIRKLYYRELVARFSHHPVLIWNLGEENQNTTAQKTAFGQYIRELDPYDHPITVHTFNNGASNYYDSLFGNDYLEATSIQGSAADYNGWAIELREESASAGKPWVIYGDEQGPRVDAQMDNVDQLVRDAIWGNLMGGGAGVEWYFGYQPNADFGDVQSEDWRVAEPLWVESGYAIDFFLDYLPFWEMAPDNALGSLSDDRVLAKPGEIYAIQYPSGTAGAEIDLGSSTSDFDVYWYDPANGGALQTGTVMSITGPGSQALGEPPSNPGGHWVALVTVDELTQPTPSPTISPPTEEPPTPTTEDPTLTPETPTPTPPDPADNLLANGSFEEALDAATNWEARFKGSTNTLFPYGPAPDGQQVLLLDGTAANGIEGVQQVVTYSGSSGDTVVLSFFAGGRSLGSGGLVGARVFLQDAGGMTVDSCVAARSVSGSLPPTQIVCEITAAADFTSILVQIGGRGVKTGLYGFDAASLIVQ